MYEREEFLNPFIAIAWPTFGRRQQRLGALGSSCNGAGCGGAFGGNPCNSTFEGLASVADVGAVPGRRPMGEGSDNTGRLHRATGYVTPRAKLDGRDQAILAERALKPEAARERRKQQRQAARHAAMDGQSEVATT